LVMTTLASLIHWRAALILCGTAGLTVMAILYRHRNLLVCAPAPAEVNQPDGPPARPGYLSAFASPVFILGFAYFALTSFSSSGVQTLGITAFLTGYAFTLPVATAAVTAYLLGNAGGVVVGGGLADLTQRHHLVAMSGMITASAAMFIVSARGGSAPLLTLLMGAAGLAYGVTQPSRDIIIRKAAAGAGLGSVFGFVYSGFDFGSGVSPLIFGAFIDGGMPHAIFLTIAIALALAAPTVMQVRRRAEAGRRAWKRG
jgi:MFS transporter, FSR family, fosmidomycin resistance protein